MKTDPLQRFVEQKELAESLRSKAERLAGAKSQHEKRLAEFGCKGLEEAKKELAKAEKEADRAEAEFAAAVEAFDRKWEGKL